MRLDARKTIALVVIGLYGIVILAFLAKTLLNSRCDFDQFVDAMTKSSFLLGPVGFVMGYYFPKAGEK